VSCTDDKTPCPCGPETRRFEAADLKAAVIGSDLDEDDPNYDEDSRGWYALENGVYVPNEKYDPEIAFENKSLYEAWSQTSRYLGRDVTDQDRAKRDAAHEAWREHYEANRDTISDKKVVPWTFKWNGKELPVSVVENNGGTEGGGEAAHMIYKVCDRLFRLDGSYYSYDGTTWDDDSFREVKPVVKEVTFYE
jgi:hypothetical protein